MAVSTVDWHELEAWLLAALEDEPGTLARLESAWQRLEHGDDPAPAAMVASLGAQIVVSSFGNLTPLAHWSERAGRFLALEPADPLARLQLASGLLCRFDHGDAKEEAAQHATRVARMGREALRDLELAGPVQHANIAVAASEQLPGHYAQTGENAHGSLCVDAQERLAALPHVDPRLAARAIYWSSAALRLLDDLPRSQAVYARLGETARALGWRWLDFQMADMDARPAFDARDASRAAAALERVKAALDLARPNDVREYHHLGGWLAAIQEDYRRAEQHHRLSLEAAEAGGMPNQVRFLCKFGVAYSLVAQGKFDEALSMLADPPTTSPRMTSVYDATRLLIEALRSRASGDEDAFARHLAAGLANMREFELYRVFQNLSRELAVLAADALERGIEPPFVAKLVAWRKLDPPPGAGERWPWALRVRALGTFTVEVDGVALEGTRKSSDHRLDLLKVLAANDGKPLAVSRVTELLWPDAGPENGRKSFDMALSRLRKLLGQEDTVLLNDGKLAFSPTLAWCDTGDFALLCEKSVSGALEDYAGRLLAAYGRGFLDGEQLEAPWAIEARERNKQRLVRQAQAVADALATRASTAAAVRLVQQAIEAEPLAESLYIWLMRSHAEAGNHAEGLRVFRRLREMLSVMLSIKPSAEALALARRMSDAAAT
jgi:DNA-binding SARP family transcriptional activator